MPHGHLKLGDIVEALFPERDYHPRRKKNAPSHGVIIGIGFDQELDMPTLTLVHAGPALERIVSQGEDFTALVETITHRVRTEQGNDRMLEIDHVVVLPLHPRFFPELKDHAHVRPAGTLDADTLTKVTAKAAAPNTAALAAFRMEEQHREIGVSENYLVNLRRAMEGKNDPNP